MKSTALLRLLQLTSPALPIGAYAYSQGLEYAISAGWVHDEESSAFWILGVLEHTLPHLDLPILVRLQPAWVGRNDQKVRYWSRLLLAQRESAELQAEDRHLGTALARVLWDQGLQEAQAWLGREEATFAALFALAAVSWEIPLRETTLGYAWTWCENQVAAAIKLVPLGQSAGQRILARAVEKIPRIVTQALQVSDEEIGAVAPGVAIASALHESQYSRLFRS